MTRILIIDDDQSICTVFQRALEQSGYSVQSAENGRVGLEILKQDPVDLVICDIMMPETDGLEVIMAMRSMRLDIPVVAISGGMQAVNMDFLPVAKSLGACRVLYKPVELSTLLLTIADVLVDSGAIDQPNSADEDPPGTNRRRDRK